jgi:hypothetical protein
MLTVELEHVCGLLMELFPRADLTEAQMEVWAQRLRSADFNVVKAAIQDHFTEHKFLRPSLPAVLAKVKARSIVKRQAVAAIAPDFAEELKKFVREECGFSECEELSGVDVVFTWYSHCWLLTFQQRGISDVDCYVARSMIYRDALNGFVKCKVPLNEAIELAKDVVGLRAEDAMPRNPMPRQSRRGIAAHVITARPALAAPVAPWDQLKALALVELSQRKQEQEHAGREVGDGTTEEVPQEVSVEGDAGTAGGEYTPRAGGEPQDHRRGDGEGSDAEDSGEPERTGGMDVRGDVWPRLAAEKGSGGAG